MPEGPCQYCGGEGTHTSDCPTQFSAPKEAATETKEEDPSALAKQIAEGLEEFVDDHSSYLDSNSVQYELFDVFQKVAAAKGKKLGKDFMEQIHVAHSDEPSSFDSGASDRAAGTDRNTFSILGIEVLQTTAGRDGYGGQIEFVNEKELAEVIEKFSAYLEA